MSALNALAQVARGQRPASGALLQNCRLEAFGTGFYGEEAILEAFRGRPCFVTADTDSVTSEGQLAVFGPDWAIIADTYDDNLGRIWHVGPGSTAPREPALAVPFDPDLSQARGGVFIRPEDHPALPAVAVEPLRRWADEEIASAANAGFYRSRAFLVRAFAYRNDVVALFAVHRLGPGPVRAAGFSYAAARFELLGTTLTGTRLVEDEPGAAAAQGSAWQPRL